MTRTTESRGGNPVCRCSHYRSDHVRGLNGHLWCDACSKPTIKTVLECGHILETVPIGKRGWCGLCAHFRSLKTLTPENSWTPRKDCGRVFAYNL